MRRFVPYNLDAALLILRLVLGIVMIVHGYPKVTRLRRDGRVLRERRHSPAYPRRGLRHHRGVGRRYPHHSRRSSRPRRAPLRDRHAGRNDLRAHQEWVLQRERRDRVSAGAVCDGVGDRVRRAREVSRWDARPSLCSRGQVAPSATCPIRSPALALPIKFPRGHHPESLGFLQQELGLTAESVRTRHPRSESTLSIGEPDFPDDDVVRRSINTIRALSMDAVEAAQSGHPGTPMALAPVAYVLWSRFLRHNPRNPTWPDRDRFVLSAGHASMLLYSLLHLTRVRRAARGGAGVPAVGIAHAGSSGARAHPGRRNHHRSAGPGRRQRGGHGDRRADPRRAFQPAGTSGHRPPHLGDRQ